MKCRGWLGALAALTIGALGVTSPAVAQQPDEISSDAIIQEVSMPPLPAGGPVPSIAPVTEPLSDFAPYNGRFLSPKCETGRCRSCEKSSGCCFFKSIYNILPCTCLKKSEGCACPPHFFCPRGHCRVKQTECARIDYRPYKTVMEPKKKETADEVADYTKARESQQVEVDLYPVFEPCCQDFWLKEDLVYFDDCHSGECQSCRE